MKLQLYLTLIVATASQNIGSQTILNADGK